MSQMIFTFFFENTNYMICESQTLACVHLILFCKRSKPTRPPNTFFRLFFLVQFHLNAARFWLFFFENTNYMICESQT